jgi:hypothetical protein
MFLSCQPKSGGVYFCTLVRVKLNFDGIVVCKLFGGDAEFFFFFFFFLVFKDFINTRTHYKIISYKKYIHNYTKRKYLQYKNYKNICKYVHVILFYYLLFLWYVVLDTFLPMYSVNLMMSCLATLVFYCYPTLPVFLIWYSPLPWLVPCFCMVYSALFFYYQ